MKTTSLALVTLLVSLTAQNSMAIGNTLNGDTIGSAQTMLSEMSSVLDRTDSPKAASGIKGFLDSFLSPVSSQETCAEIGGAVGYAFSVQTAVLFYTDKFNSNKYKFHRHIHERINDLIISITNTRNDYCISNNNMDERALQTRISSTQQIIKELSADLDHLLLK
jgi:hypothetical protein